MIVRLNKEIRSYYAAPHTFTKQCSEQKVSAKMGRYLLDTGYFKKIGESDDIDDAEEEIDEEVEASEQKKLYDESKAEAKKKSTKKDK